MWKLDFAMCFDFPTCITVHNERMCVNSALYGKWWISTSENWNSINEWYYLKQLPLLQARKQQLSPSKAAQVFCPIITFSYKRAFSYFLGANACKYVCWKLSRDLASQEIWLKWMVASVWTCSRFWCRSNSGSIHSSYFLIFLKSPLSVWKN